MLGNVLLDSSTVVFYIHVILISHNIKTHGSVSAAKKSQENTKKLKYARAHYLCYLRDRSSSRFQPIIT